MSPLWIFGYGSLIWRPDFPHAESRRALVRGFVRRFWQGSPDHRGTPEAPGRVVTLVEEPGARCSGVAFRVGDDLRESVLARLDGREQGGYRRVATDLELDDGTRVPGLLYLAGADNEHYLGPAPIEDIAEVVRVRTGPSGSNVEYVLRLAEALAALDARDEHVETLASLVRA